jgi:hypothetical protein
MGVDTYKRFEQTGSEIGCLVAMHIGWQIEICFPGDIFFIKEEQF